MGPNQFPGQTLQPLPASPAGFYVGDDEFSLLQKICQNLYAISQAGSGAGATIAATTNLISGDNAGNGVNSGVVPSTVIIGVAGATANLFMTSTGSGNGIQPTGIVNATSGGAPFIGTPDPVNGPLYIGSNNGVRVTGNILLANADNGFTSFDNMFVGPNANNSNLTLKADGTGIIKIISPVGVSDANNSTVVTALTLVHNIAGGGSGAIGMGEAILFQSPSDTTALRSQGRFFASWTGVAAAAENSTISIIPIGAGSETPGLVVGPSALNFNGAALAILSFDTGWVANADAGDKTDVIPSSATIATVQAALNLLSSGAGDVVATVAEKVKAMESAFANGLVPNL